MDGFESGIIAVASYEREKSGRKGGPARNRAYTAFHSSITSQNKMNESCTLYARSSSWETSYGLHELRWHKQERHDLHEFLDFRIVNEHATVATRASLLCY